MRYSFKPVVFIKDEYNPNLHTVAQYGFVDLRVASSTGVVPANLEDTMQFPNGIEDPNSIIGRPDDVFATKRAMDVYKSTSTVEAPSSLSPESGGESA